MPQSLPSLQIRICFNRRQSIPSQDIFGYLFIMAKKSAGRPALAPEQKRQGRFVVKLNDEEFERIKLAVGEAKLTTWAREVLLRSAKRK